MKKEIPKRNNYWGEITEDEKQREGKVAREREQNCNQCICSALNLKCELTEMCILRD